MPGVVLIAIAATALLLPVQAASAAGPVAGAIAALGTSAQQQLAAVAQDASVAVPLPPPSVPAVPATVVPATKDAPAAADSAPQTVVKAVTDLASNADGGSKRPRADELAETARSGPSDASSRATAAPILAATERAERATPSGRRLPTGRTRILGVTREIVAANAKPLTRSLAHAAQTLQHAPAARDLGERTSRVAGALIGTVAAVAAVAHEAIFATPVAGLAPLLPASGTALAGMQPQRLTGEAATSAPALSPSAAQALPAAGSPAISSTGPATAPGTSAGGWPLGAMPRSPLPGITRAGTPTSKLGGTTHFARLSGPSTAPHATPPAAVAATTSPPVQMPGGSAPVSGAGATGGLSGSALLALAALLLLAAPRAMRRLRLAAGSWRAAQFVLIPERPG